MFFCSLSENKPPAMLVRIKIFRYKKTSFDRIKAGLPTAKNHRYGNRHFRCRGYYVDTVGRNRNAIEAYIKNQMQEDIMADQISLKEYIDPFTGSKNSKA